MWDGGAKPPCVEVHPPLDASYRVPAKKKEFLSVISGVWSKFRALNNIPDYEEESNDCENAAFQLFTAVHLWNTQVRDEKQGLSFGYWECNAREHAFNFFLWGPQLKLVWIEPQSIWLPEIKLTEEEKCVRNFAML